MSELRSYSTIGRKKMEKNKSEYKANLHCKFDRVLSFVHKSNIFSTISFFHFRKKSSFIKKCIASKISVHNKTHHFRNILTK
jgi:hypothetical protein